MAIVIHLATTDAEREAIYRLRYDIYVEEMQSVIQLADHARRMLSDADDLTARLFYAIDGDQIVGTLRLNLGKDTPFSLESEMIYDLGRFRPVVSEAHMAILSRFMVRKRYRGTRLPLQFMAEATRAAIVGDVQLAFCDCQPHLIGLYRSLGFRSYTPVYNDPHNGILLPLVLVCGDVAHLERIKSPLLRFISPMAMETEVVQQLKHLLDDSSERDTDADTATDHWSEAYNLLSEREEKKIHFFAGLTEEKIRSIITKSHVIDCAPGDRVIVQGQVTSTLFVVLAGAAEVRVHDHIVRVVTPGNVIGEVAFLLGTPRTADVYAVGQGTRVLVLHEKTLRSLSEGSSHIGSIVLHNLAKLLAFKFAETASRANMPQASNTWTMATA